mmetsp:Transcript_511/g.1023  ORF Transcript_511/g.1023 Transcript_511/m.1023 type:complete len:367 (+) Transcript_511:705-1805(+)
MGTPSIVSVFAVSGFGGVWIIYPAFVAFDNLLGVAAVDAFDDADEEAVRDALVEYDEDHPDQDAKGVHVQPLLLLRVPQCVALHVAEQDDCVAEQPVVLETAPEENPEDERKADHERDPEYDETHYQAERVLEGGNQDLELAVEAQLLRVGELDEEDGQPADQRDRVDVGEVRLEEEAADHECEQAAENGQVLLKLVQTELVFVFARRRQLLEHGELVHVHQQHQHRDPAQRLLLKLLLGVPELGGPPHAWVGRFSRTIACAHSSRTVDFDESTLGRRHCFGSEIDTGSRLGLATLLVRVFIVQVHLVFDVQIETVVDAEVDAEVLIADWEPIQVHFGVKDCVDRTLNDADRVHLRVGLVSTGYLD